MKTLFIDTSCDDLIVAILEDDKLIKKLERNCKNEHSIYTVSYIDKLLNSCNLLPNDIDNIMVVNGPGSFTGVRIGVSIAKTYAYILKKDIIVVSSLKAMALSVKNKIAISLIDAKNNNYYMGIYDIFDNEVTYETFSTKEEVIQKIQRYQDATVISNKDLVINEYEAKKVKLDIEAIVKYYKNEEPTKIDAVLPNYLKLPQVLEEK